MRKKTLLAIAAASAVALGVVAYLTFNRPPRSGEPLTLYGNVDVREVELAFRQTGRISSIAVDEGDAVTAGQIVAQLDPEPFEQTVAAAEAEVLAARAELARQRIGNRPQEIAQAVQRVNEARARFTRAEADLDRQKALQMVGAASVRTVESAQAERDASAAGLEALEQALSLQRAGSRDEDIAAAEARLAAAIASRDRAETTLADTRLVAPESGIVLARIREPGAIVANGGSVLTLSLRDPIYVRAYVPETELGQVVPGKQVQLRTDSSARFYTGQIGFVSPTAEFTPRTVETADLRTDLVYRLRIVVRDADDGLRQGMPVTLLVPPSGSAAR